MKDIKNDAEDQIKQSIKQGMILTYINHKNIEFLSRLDIANIIKNTSRPFTLVFRDPHAFIYSLNSSNYLGSENYPRIMSTRLSRRKASHPSDDVITVERLEVYKMSFLCV